MSTERSLKNRKTFFHFVLDRSGSMADCWIPTMSGLEEQFSMVRHLQMKHPDQEFYISLCMFDNIIEFPVPVSPGAGMYQHLYQNVQPRANTALFDAVGDSIRQMEFHAGALLSRGEASVVMVVLTDGMENASVRYSGQMIGAEILRLEATGLWSFSFLGADFDITQMASELNVKQQSTMVFEKKKVVASLRRVSEAMCDYAEEKSAGNLKKDLLD